MGRQKIISVYGSQHLTSWPHRLCVNDTKAGVQETKPEARPYPKTSPGRCVVCLADRNDVLDAQWLHQESFLDQPGGTRLKAGCHVSACLPCLKTYFEGIVARGFDGVCPRMSCLSCPRVVCERAWAPLVDPSTVEIFKRRARTLLSFKCSGCHSFMDVMAMPSDQEQSYSSTLGHFMHNVASGFNFNFNIKQSGIQQYAQPACGADCVAWKPELEAFFMSLRRYASGYDINVATFYDSVESVVFAGLEKCKKDDEKRSQRMEKLLHCIEDNERRASLQLRFLMFHPMVPSKCCGRLHCFRCKISDGHPMLTCEQYETLRGVQDVLRCPQCGVHVVKSDGEGCDAITCVCLATFSWRALLQQRDLREVEAFSGLYPEDPPRAAVKILRRGPPRSLDDEKNHSQSLIMRAWPRIQLRNAACSQHASPEEFRLASVFVRKFPRKFSAARAAIFGEEHKHFTAQRAMRQATSIISNEPQLAWGCFSCAPSCGTADNINYAESEWKTLAARDWLQENREVLRDLRRQAKAARFALVDALYGGDNHPAIAAIAAVCARDVFQNTSTASDQELAVARQEKMAYEGGNLGSREMSRVLRRHQKEREDPIPELSASWRARPLVMKGKVHSSTTAVGSRSSNRGLSWGFSFGSQCLEGDVELWVDASPSRAKHLKDLVVSAEERLSNAWVALWGQRQFKQEMIAVSVTALAEAGQDESEEVQAAARRCAFLDAHPEYACREHTLMMEAFMCRNKVAVERARANAIIQRAAACELMYKAHRSVHPKDAASPETATNEDVSDALKTGQKGRL